MRSALASVFLLIAAGAGISDLHLHHLLLCFNTGECRVGLIQPPNVMPESVGELCVLPAQLPCVVQGES